MHGQNAVFLTREEAVDAIRIDLQQYEAQTGLLCELFPTIMGADAVAVPDNDPHRVWIKSKARGPMRPISSDELADTLFSKMTSTAASTQRLADVCASVFKEPVVAGVDTETRREGVWIETGMAGYACRQCGCCCLALDYHSECTAEDYQRWQSLGRDDILQWVRLIPKAAGTHAYRIWVAPGEIEPAPECPFLQNESGTGRYYCGIHAVKPAICRQYPFTRKHARMTGCPAFDQD